MNPDVNYLLKVKNGNTRIMCEICSKLTIKTPERRNWRRSGVFIVNFEHSVFIVNFEHVIAGWEEFKYSKSYRATRKCSLSCKNVVISFIYFFIFMKKWNKKPWPVLLFSTTKNSIWTPENKFLDKVKAKKFSYADPQLSANHYLVINIILWYLRHFQRVTWRICC